MRSTIFINFGTISFMDFVNYFTLKIVMDNTTESFGGEEVARSNLPPSQAPRPQAINLIQTYSDFPDK